MSYILDALKRAESERGQTQPTSSPEPAWLPATAPARRKPQVWRWGLVAAALGLAGVAAVAWPTKGSGEMRIAAADSTPAAQPAPAPAPAPFPVPVPVPVPVVQTAPLPSPDMLSTLPAPPPLPPGISPQQVLKRVPLPPGPSKTPPPPPRAPAMAAPATPKPANKPLASTSGSQGGHPAIDISGTAYSTNPEHRMLIANGKVVKEGQEISPGLTLEAIGPRSAVFNQGGSRFNVNY